MEQNAVQENAMQEVAAQENAVQDNAVQESTVQESAMHSATVPASPFRLGNLPSELVKEIFSFLPLSSLSEVRLVNSEVSKHSIDAFGAHISHLVVILHPRSLQVLRNIQCHPLLAKYVRRVTVSFQKIVTFLYQHDIERTNHNVKLLAQLAKEQHDSLTQGRHVPILVEAFSNLPNLREVAFENFDFAPDSSRINGYTRCGDRILKGEFMEWHYEHSRSLFATAILPAIAIPLSIRANTSVFFKLDNDPSYMEPVMHLWAFWMHRLALQIRTLAITNHGPASSSLLQSASNTKNILLKSVPRSMICSLSQPNFAFYPGLHRFKIVHIVNLNSLHLASFLDRHADTLTEVSLNDMSLPSNASWVEPLCSLQRMPRISELSLVDLGASGLTPATSLNTLTQEFFRGVPPGSNPDYHSIELRGTNEISQGLGALIAGYQTSPVISRLGRMRRTRFYLLTNCIRAWRSGHVVQHLGEWKLTAYFLASFLADCLRNLPRQRARDFLDRVRSGDIICI